MTPQLQSLCVQLQAVRNDVHAILFEAERLASDGQRRSEIERLALRVYACLDGLLTGIALGDADASR